MWKSTSQSTSINLFSTFSVWKYFTRCKEMLILKCCKGHLISRILSILHLFLLQMFNTMPYPQPGYLSRLQQTPPTSSSTYAPRPPPRYTTIDMKDTGYPSKQDTPQPLIRAIKDELLRLSQNAQGKTRIQELPNT